MKKTGLILIFVFVCGIRGFGQVLITHYVHDSILYTSFTPDTILYPVNCSSCDTSVSFQSDLNKDGINDYGFSIGQNYQFFSPTCCEFHVSRLGALDTNSGVAFYETSVGQTSACIINLDSSEFIDNRFNWNGNFLNVSQYMYGCGEPYGYNYFPIKFYLNGNYYFGWFYLESIYANIELREMAVCLIPNQSIYTGHKGLYFPPPIAPNSPIPITYSELNIFPNPSIDGNYSIQIPDDIATSADILLSVYDDKGSEVLNYDYTDKRITKEISLSGKSNGIYLVRLSNGSKSYTGKIIKK